MPSLEKVDLDFQSNTYLILANQNLLFLLQNFYHNLSILLPRDSMDSQLGAYLLDWNDLFTFSNKNSVEILMIKVKLVWNSDAELAKII